MGFACGRSTAGRKASTQGQGGREPSRFGYGVHLCPLWSIKCGPVSNETGPHQLKEEAYSAFGAVFSLVSRLTTTAVTAAGIRQTKEEGKLVIPSRSIQATREPTIIAARAP